MVYASQVGVIKYVSEENKGGGHGSEEVENHGYRTTEFGISRTKAIIPKVNRIFKEENEAILPPHPMHPIPDPYCSTENEIAF